jgi:uncharacterized coiled-coil protein SlyX
MPKPIKLSDELALKFEALKLRLRYTKNTDFINDMCDFFEVNNVNLKSENYKSSFTVLTEFLNKKFNQLQARNTAVERDYFVSFNRKIDSIYEESIKNDIAKSNEKLVENLPKLDNSNEDHSFKITEFEKLILSQEKSIDSSNNIIAKQDDLIKEYHRCLKLLNENIKFENGISGKKVFINLPLEEANKLFYLIP